MSVNEKVKIALNNAKENDYSFENMSPYEIAVDLATYDSELENAPICEIINAVILVQLSTAQRRLLNDNESFINSTTMMLLS